MRLYGSVSNVSMRKFGGKFDVDTGQPDPTYILQAMVTDLDNPQSIYQCSFTQGFGLEALREARKAKASEAERDQLAAQAEAQAKQLEGQHLELLVMKGKAKNNFLSLSVGSVQALPPAEAQVAG